MYGLNFRFPVTYDTPVFIGTKSVCVSVSCGVSPMSLLNLLVISIVHVSVSFRFIRFETFVG